LPDNSTVDLWPVDDPSALQAQLPAGQNYVVGFGVTWQAQNGSSPAASTPATLTVLDSSIHAGDTIYLETRAGLQAAQGAVVSDGKAVITFTNDPVIILGEPHTEFAASSYHQNDGYFIATFVADPNHDFSAVTVSGPGLTGSVAMTYNTGSGRWEIPASLLGTTLPTGSRTYDFTATPAAGGNPVTDSVTVSVYVDQFATNLQPTGNVTTARPTFSWTGFQGADNYVVMVGDQSDNWIWTSLNLPPDQTSVLYAGPSLTAGQTYHYRVVALVNTDGNRNSSFADGQFTYVGPPPPGDINADGSVDLTDAVLALQTVDGRNPPGITLHGDTNGDHKIDIQDLGYIMQCAAGLRTPAAP